MHPDGRKELLVGKEEVSVSDSLIIQLIFIWFLFSCGDLYRPWCNTGWALQGALPGMKK
ncbi:hypothetical protein ACOJCM_02985 [Billgrantia sp. LNSP4103-1]|uniref:hypothetical protein n=1 Tax=Billgrantia sp. LNSP4103-1 TaxID=3410266 RepID=UPI00403FA819